MSANPLISLVPKAGVEPAQAQGPGDFESPASTNSTTPALIFKRAMNRVYGRQLSDNPAIMSSIESANRA